MDVAVLLSFAAASLVLAAAPGPDILYVLAQSAQSGARAGLMVVIGLMIGCLIQTAAASAQTARATVIDRSALLRRGIIMNVTNPKVQIFFLAFFPQFATRGATGWQMAMEMGLLGVIFTVCAFVVMAGCALFAGVLSDTIRSPRVQIVLNKASAFIFIGLALAAVVS